MSKITNSKFMPPEIKRKFWLNDNLEEKFNQLDNHALTILKAGIGTGKTSSLFSFLEKKQQSICCYQIEKSELDYIEFWNNIFKMLEIDSLIEVSAQNLFDFSKPYQSIELLISNYLSELDDDLYIILDNFELIKNNQLILETISYFIELSDSNIHLIICTTRELKFSKLALWKVKNKALQINEEEFMLDKREVGDFFSQLYHLLLSNKEEEMILAKTNGWLLAVDLLAKKAKEGIDVTDLVLNTEQKCDLLFEYLDYQVLSFLDKEKPKLKEFLLKTAILPQLEVEICNCFLESDNSSKLINELIQAGVLIQESQAGVYEYNPILKEFLQQKTKQIYDYKELIKRAKRVFYQHNNLEQIMNYNLKSNNSSEIIDLIHHNIEEWLAESKLDLLKKSFNALSENDLEDKPLLLIYQGDLYRKLEKFDQSISSYQQAEELFKANNEEEKLIIALFRLADLFAFFSSNRCSNYIDKLLYYESDFSKEQQNKMLQLKIVDLLIKGKFEVAELQVEQLKSYDQAAYKELRANILFCRGKLFKAKKLLEEIRFHNHYEYILYHTLILPALFYLFIGKLVSAQRYIWSELSAGDGYINQFANYYLLMIYQLLGVHKIDYCKERYNSFLEETKQYPFGICWYRIQIHRELVFWEALYGSPQKGLESADQALIAAIKRDDIFAQGNILMIKGFNYYALEQFSKAEEVFSQAIEKLVKSGAKLHFFISLLGRAEVVHQQGRIEEFKVDMKQAISYLKKNPDMKFIFNRTSTLIRDSNLIVNLFNKAKNAGITKSYINDIFRQNKLNEVEHTPPYMLKIKCFANLRLFRGREAVLGDEWTRKSAKDLLKLFLVNYGESISKEKICSLLWPDKEPKSASRSFHVALNNLNKILEPDRQSRAKAFFISKKDDYYGLTKEFTYHYDVALFEKFIKQGKESNIEKIKIKFYQEAVAIYKNDFLVNDLDYDWIIDERERLEKLYLEILEELMKYNYQIGEYQQTIELADEILTKNNYIEPAYLYKIKSYDQLGKRALAIVTYETCEEIFRNHLDITPNQDLKKYYNYLKM